MCHLKRGLFFFPSTLMKCSVVPVGALDRALLDNHFVFILFQTEQHAENIKIRHRNEKKIEFILCSFSMNLNCLKLKKKPKTDMVKSFLYLLLCIMLCMVVLALAFCKLLAHLLFQRVKKTKQEHPSVLISMAMTGTRKKKSTNKLLSTKSVDVMKQCLAQATATIN